MRYPGKAAESKSDCNPAAAKVRFPAGGTISMRYAVALLAAEQLVARQAEPLGLGVEQRVLDRSHRLGDHAARCGPGDAVELRVDALVCGDVLADHALGEPLDRRRDAGRAEALVVFAPPDDAFVGRKLDEAVVAPAPVAMQRLDPGNFHRGSSPFAGPPGP